MWNRSDILYTIKIPSQSKSQPYEYIKIKKNLPIKVNKKTWVSAFIKRFYTLKVLSLQYYKKNNRF